MFSLFISATMLAVDSSHVIALRLSRIACGGMEAADETQLMVSERFALVPRLWKHSFSGGTTAAVVVRYQEHVSANIRRLSRR
jgi:hypothetical protein